MAITLTANYQKRLGLPGFSSHSFQVSLESEITDLGEIQGEVARLYDLLQDAVDREIQTVGFVPGDDYGLSNGNDRSHPNGIGTSNGNGNHNGNGRSQYRIDDSNGSNGHSDHWSCSDKQKELILQLVAENNLDRDTVEQTALDRFGVGLRMLNKLQASGLIDELFEIVGNSGRKRNGSPNGSQRKGGGQ